MRERMTTPGLFVEIKLQDSIRDAPYSSRLIILPFLLKQS
jgi:hypothetical protein